MVADDYRLNGMMPDELTPAKRIVYELITAGGMVSASGVLTRIDAPHGSPVAPMINVLLLFSGVGWVERVGEPGQRAVYVWKGPKKLEDIGPATWETMEGKIAACFKPEAVQKAVAEKKAQPDKPTIRERIRDVLEEADTWLTKQQIRDRLDTLNPDSINTMLSLMRKDGDVLDGPHFEFCLKGRGDLPPSKEPLSGEQRQATANGNTGPAARARQEEPKAEPDPPREPEPPAQAVERVPTPPAPRRVIHQEPMPPAPKMELQAMPEQPQVHRIEFPIPGKSPVVILLPEDIDAEDYAMVRTMLEHYVRRWRGFVDRRLMGDKLTILEALASEVEILSSAGADVKNGGWDSTEIRNEHSRLLAAAQRLLEEVRFAAMFTYDINPGKL